MIVRPVDFAVVQQMNEVSHIKQEENQRPVVEHFQPVAIVYNAIPSARQ